MVFVKRTEKTQPGFSVGVTLSRTPTKGQVGLEIEVEGNKFPKPEGMAGAHHPVPMPKLVGWSYVHDGSLRGKDNAEYILTSPVMFDTVEERVKALYTHLADYGAKIDDSNRTSVHVHLNCQDFYLNRLTSLMALYFIFEEVLTEWCGDHRVGNLFCLRAKDAPSIVSQIRRFIRADGSMPLSDGLHYSAMNVSALAKFGSLEWRTLRGCPEPSTVIEWVSILQRLYELSGDFRDPRDICSLFSASGPVAFFDDILGDKGVIVRKGISMTTDQIADSMYDGIRLAQDLCFCRDWSLYSPVDLKADPFGRDPRKMAKKLVGQDASSPPMGALPTTPAPNPGGMLHAYWANPPITTIQQAPPTAAWAVDFDTATEATFASQWDPEV